MSRYYGFTPAEIGDMSSYQFNSYMYDISEIERMFSGSESSKKGSISNKELIRRAKQKGLKTPKHF